MEGKILGKEIEKVFKPPKHVILTFDELVRLIVCIVFDLVEYAIPILLGPLVGDVLDIVGIGAAVLMFGWIGSLSLLEFLPMADILPIFVFTWFVWYYFKKRREKREKEELQKKWK